MLGPRTTSALLTAVLLIAVFGAPAIASAAVLPQVSGQEAAAPPAVGIVKSKTVYDAVSLQFGSTGYGDLYYTRADSVLDLLDGEFANVSFVGDAELNSSDPNVLGAYDVLVFPRHIYMTETQRVHTREYVARGGSIVAMFMLASGHYTGSQVFAYKDYYSWGVPATFMNGWRWGETSELHMTRFVNDGYMYAGYQVQRYPGASHWILDQTDADMRTLGYTGMRIAAKVDDFPETVTPMSGVPIKPLLKYVTTTNANSGDDVANNTLAGWASEYYYGRIVYFPFPLYDYARSSYYGDTQTERTAERLIVNSVRWATAEDGYGQIEKHVTITSRAAASLRTISVQPTFRNDSDVAMNGTMRASFIDPRGATVYTGVRNNVALPAGWTYPDTPVYLFRWTSPSAPRAGTWTVRYQYTYHDLMHGGWATAYRDVYFTSNGSRFAYKTIGKQVDPAGSQPIVGDMLAGLTRYETAAEIVADAFPDGVSEQRAVVLASGQNFNDALTVSGLAGKLDAPILLVNPAGLPAAVGARLTALYSGEPSAAVYVVGDASVVPEAVVASARAAIEGAGVPSAEITVTRIGSGDAYARAAAVASETGLPDSGPLAGSVIVATGDNYADALSVCPLAARHHVPLLFVTPGAVPQATRDALAALSPEHTLIVGGTGAVGDAVEDWLETSGYRVPGVALNTPSADSRLAGLTRYDTSLAILDATVDPELGGFAGQGLVFATGTLYPDALAGGPLCERRDDPLLLVNGIDLGRSASVASYVHKRRANPPVPLTFLGGTGAVSAFTRGEIGVGLKTNW